MMKSVVATAMGSDVSYAVMHGQPYPVPAPNEVTLRVRWSAGLHFPTGAPSSAVPGRIAVGTVVATGSNVAPSIVNVPVMALVVNAASRGSASERCVTLAHLVAPLHGRHTDEARAAAFCEPLLTAVMVCSTRLHLEDREVVYVHSNNASVLEDAIIQVARCHGCRILRPGDVGDAAIADVCCGVGVDAAVVMGGPTDWVRVASGLTPGGRVCVLGADVPPPSVMQGLARRGCTVSFFDLATVLLAGNRHDLVGHALRRVAQLIGDGHVEMRGGIHEIDVGRAAHMQTLHPTTMTSDTAVLGFDL